MKPSIVLSAAVAAGLAMLALTVAAAPVGGGPQPTIVSYDDPLGRVATINVNGPTVEKGNPFFDPALGSNGRSCSSCHQARDGWTIGVPTIRARFKESHGTDPLFRPIDGATCPSDDVSTPAATAKAYSLLLNKGLIRVSLPIPDNAEFKVVAIDDPYHCSTPTRLSVYRRPLPATNLRFLATIMWDGRHPTLAAQALDAANTHMEAKEPPPSDILERIVAFESGTYTAQAEDRIAGPLDATGARGGPAMLPAQKFFVGINDPFDRNPTGAVTDEDIFGLYQPWHKFDSATAADAARASIARGQQLFDNRPMTMIGVAGLTDVRNVNAITVTCGTCHDTPGIGSHSVNELFDIKTSDPEQRTPDLPLFTLQCTDGSTHVTSDPGQALISGRCADINKFKVSSLRGLAAHPPYFHNGTAATLADVVTFYDTRFIISLSEQERADLVAFLGSL